MNIACSFLAVMCDKEMDFLLTDYQSEVHRQDSDWKVWDRCLVLLPVPRWVRQAAQTVDLRVLPQVHETGEDISLPPGGRAGSLQGREALTLYLLSWCEEKLNWLWCQKQVTQAGTNNCIPQNTMGCDYLSLPEIPASSTKVLHWYPSWTPKWCSLSKFTH